MKATLEFDIENPDWTISEREKEKLACAKKGWEMSGFIDTFLDYLITCGPHIKMDELLNTVMNMYYNKLEEYELFDILEPDLQEVVKEWDYCCQTEDDASDIFQKALDEYRATKLEKTHQMHEEIKQKNKTKK